MVDVLMLAREHGPARVELAVRGAPAGLREDRRRRAGTSSVLTALSDALSDADVHHAARGPYTRPKAPSRCFPRRGTSSIESVGN